MSYLLIAHDLAVVRQLAQRVAVMYLGKLLEVAGRDDLFAAPAHPYTRALLSAVPVPDPEGREHRRRIVLVERGEARWEGGCRFLPRCWMATELCAAEEPELVARGGDRRCACHHAPA